MFKIAHNLLRNVKSTSATQGHLRLNNLVSIPVTLTVRNIENEDTTESKAKTSVTANKLDTFRSSKGQNSLVAAAFSMLKDEKSFNEIKTPFTDERIVKARTVDELLVITEGLGVSRRLALKIISVLSDWATSGKVDMQEFETDLRFIRLCKILTKGTSVVKNNRPTNNALHNEDLSTILGVTAEEDAAKLMSSISLGHMVKVMSFLALKHHRSTTLLRTLAFSISGKGEHLNLKHCADLLYSAAVLNFIDDNFLDKVCGDIFAGLETFDEKSAVVGSILTSLGHLRFKNPLILDALSTWVLKYQNNCRPQDIFALFITLAILNHQPSNSEDLYKVLVPQLSFSDARKLTVWLDIVWSLVVLKQANTEHIASVLSESFISKLKDVKYSNGIKLKLLNIDSACDSLITNYNGPRIPSSSDIKQVVLVRSKDKENMVSLLQDSLSSLVNPITHLKTNIDTKMGFYIDAEIGLDKKHNPLPLDHRDCVKVAILAHDFHDMCHGRVESTGINSLYARLLEAQGYRILVVPYKEFGSSDKYVNRVKYIESRLKTLDLN